MLLWRKLVDIRPASLFQRLFQICQAGDLFQTGRLHDLSKQAASRAEKALCKIIVADKFVIIDKSVNNDRIAVVRLKFWEKGRIVPHKLPIAGGEQLLVGYDGGGNLPHHTFYKFFCDHMLLRHCESSFLFYGNRQKGDFSYAVD